RAAGVPVRPGSPRLFVADAPLQHRCLRSRSGGGPDAGGGRSGVDRVRRRDTPGDAPSQAAAEAPAAEGSRAEVAHAPGAACGRTSLERVAAKTTVAAARVRPTFVHSPSVMLVRSQTIIAHVRTFTVGPPGSEKGFASPSWMPRRLSTYPATAQAR